MALERVLSTKRDSFNSEKYISGRFACPTIVENESLLASAIQVK